MFALNKWIKKKIMPLLIGVGVIFFLCQIFFVSFLIRDISTQQKKLVSNFTRMSLTAVSRHQIEVLDQLAAISINDNGTSVIFLCENDESVIWSYPISVKSCSYKNEWLLNEVESSFFSDKEFPKLVFILPYFPNLNIVLWIFLFVAIVIATCMILLFKIKRHIHNGLYLPVKKIGSNNQHFEIDEFEKIHLSLLELQAKEKDFAAQAARFNLSTQLAHDIRSPLAALQVATNMIDEMPDEAKELMNKAAKRIQDISNDLLKKNRDDKSDAAKNEFLPNLVEEIISEKNLQYQSRPGIKIIFDYDKKNKNNFYANVVASELKRILSNLINNAVEALQDQGTITIKLFSDAQGVHLQIIDNGKGIPEEILPKLMQQGETHGKANGSGLGLFHARTNIEKWGGQISLTSKMGKGTCVGLVFPKI